MPFRDLLGLGAWLFSLYFIVLWRIHRRRCFIEVVKSKSMQRYGTAAVVVTVAAGTHTVTVVGCLLIM